MEDLVKQLDLRYLETGELRMADTLPLVVVMSRGQEITLYLIKIFNQKS